MGMKLLKSKVTQGELNITEGLCILHKLEAEGILDVEIERWTTGCENTTS
jgi:hypothetical protein